MLQLTQTDIIVKNFVADAVSIKAVGWLAWFLSLSVAIMVLFVLYYFLFIKMDKKFILLSILAGIVTAIVVEFLKLAVLRPRPDASDLLSFPSRHAALAFLVAYVVIAQNPKSKIRLLLIPWAFLAAFSRLLLAQHYLTDVLAGGLIGLTFGFLFFNFYKKKKLKVSRR